MASRRRIVPDAGRDLISQLRVVIKNRILECLSTRDAARTALLSTHWKDVWSRHGRLVFDHDFFQKCRGDETTTILSIINNILLLRAGPVKKFTLIVYFNPKPHQSDIERWCLFLSRNGVEELNLVLCVPGYTYKLPVCIFSCPTINRMKLGGLLLDLPVNADCIFPGVTLLCVKNVELKHSVNEIASSIPNLEKLIFNGFVEGINKFDINAPKLKSLSSTVSHFGFEPRWFSLHMKAIKTLCLSWYFLAKSREDKEAASRLLEDLDRCVINHDMKMLKTVKIESFSGSPVQNLFVKSVFSKSPTLERVVIQECDKIKASMAVKILRELSSFSRASPKAQLVYMEYKSTYSLIGNGVDDRI